MRRVFIVDDHPLVVEWLGALVQLQKDFMVCGQAPSVEKAKEGIVATTPDLVIVDLSLDGDSGLELMKFFADQPHAPRFLVLSMYNELVYAERAFRSGARAYVMKGETTTRIVTALHEVVNGRLFFSEAVKDRINRLSSSKRSEQTGSLIEALSDREFQIFQLIGSGRETRRIAEQLKINVKTVQTYCTRIKEKLHLETWMDLTTEAILWNERQGRF